MCSNFLNGITNKGDTNIMIDYINTDLLTTPEYLLSNQNLSFGANVDEQTGELIKNRHGFITKVANFGSMKITISTNAETNYTKIQLSGSLHKHKQQSVNFNDFTFNDVCNTIQELCQKLCLQPEKFVLRHIEYGVNIKPVHTPLNLLNSIIAYKGKGYEKKEYKGTGYLKKFCLSQYNLKIYDKSKQYDLPYNVLRYELKVFKMQFFENKKIQLKTFSDLLNSNTYSQLNSTIYSSIQDLYMFDYRINSNLITNLRERLVLTEGSNSEFWTNYRTSKTPKAFQKKVKRFKDLVKRYAPDNLQNYLLVEISNKWSELLNSTPNLPNVEFSKVPIIYPYIVSKNKPQIKSYCKTCGRDISDQKPNSVFCSEKRFGPIAKRCRNRMSNLKRDEKRKYRGPTLFDVDQYLPFEMLILKRKSLI